MSLAPWKPAAILAALTFAVFTPSLAAGLVYDARMQILTDGFIHDGRNWPDVLTGRVLGRDVLDGNRPAHLASLMADAAVWGKNPIGYHLTSILLHVANTLLLFTLVRRFVASPTAIVPFLAACLFALHPIVTEAVCEPSYREDLLVACFSLAGLVLAMGHDASRPGSDPWRALGCGLCCLLAIAAKESGIAAPMLLTAYWLLYRRQEPARFWMLAAGSAKVVVLAFLAARFLLEPNPSRIFTDRPQYPGGSLGAALLLEPRILALYAQLVVWPANLCADYGLASLGHLPLPTAVVVLAGIVTAAAVAARHDRRLLLAYCLVVFPLLPVLNVVPIYKPAADRYLYLPLAGVAVAVACLLDSDWLARRDTARRCGLAGCAAAAVLAGLACFGRQAVWADSLALWDDGFRKNPASATAATGLGEALREAGRLGPAEQAIRQAIRLTNGSRGDLPATLALILDEQGRAAEASQALAAALQLDPRLADPDELVAALAMDRPTADDLKDLLARQPGRPIWRPPPKAAY